MTGKLQNLFLTNLTILAKRIISIVCLVIIAWPSLSAQVNDYSKADLYPYHLSPYKEAGLMVLGTTFLYAGGFSQRVLKPMQMAEIEALDANNIPFFDRYVSRLWNPELNTVREILEPIGIVAAIGTIGGIGLQKKASTFTWYPLMSLTMMYFEGFYITEGATLLIKSLAKRPRPYTYNKSLPIEERLSSSNNESFFSGNASVMFYNATFISQMLSDIYPEKKWIPYVWAGTHGVALVSGIWSIQSGMHFGSDVLLGALWGSGIAWATLKLHKINSNLTASPFASVYGKGLTLTYRIPKG